MVDRIGTGNGVPNASSVDNKFSAVDSADALTSNNFRSAARLGGRQPTTAMKRPTGVLTVPLATQVAGKNRSTAPTPITAAQVEAVTQRAVQKYWSLYQRELPEAFSGPTSKLSRTPPTILFAKSRSEYQQLVLKATGKEGGETNDASFDPKNPRVFYVNTQQLTAMAQKKGLRYVEATISHELIHVASTGMLQRMESDSTSRLPASAAAREILNRRDFTILNKDNSFKTFFSVRDMLSEFPADYFAEKLTGIQADSSYGDHVKIGRELIKRVGEATLRKALFANDPVAYQKVLQGARELSEENKRETNAKRTD